MWKYGWNEPTQLAKKAPLPDAIPCQKRKMWVVGYIKFDYSNLASRLAGPGHG